MKSICYTSVFLTLTSILFFGSCNKINVYDQKAKSLDSIVGAVNSIIKELQDIDTLALQKSIARYTWYRQFIAQNVNDTITRNEAEDLQHFYTAGGNLAKFSSNRKLILTRGTLVNSQLAKLTEDIKKKAISEEQLSKYSLYERTEAVKLIEYSYSQQKLFHSSLEEFKNSLKGVELLIRSRNKGELPTIVKDTINL